MDLRPKREAAMSVAGVLAKVAALVGIGVVPLLAQDSSQGAITGRVLNNSSEPLGQVQIVIVGRDLGALTAENGRFLLPNVPAGTHTIRAERIGFQTLTREVTVQPGANVQVDFELREAPLMLDAIVVTGTAGGTRRRAIGNVVASVDADAVVTRSPIASIDQLIGQRTPGVVMMPATGSVGSGSAVRIRGIASITQGTDPMVYVDGIRMDSNPRDGPAQRGGANQSRLNDINPADIESIEIIKGPAAATLYGTEASNGVIQIITKRGAAGGTQFDLSTRIGVNWLLNPAGRTGLKWALDPTSNELYSVNVYELQRASGHPDPYGSGLLQGYNLNVRGGTDAIRYYASASRDHDVGIVDWNWNKRHAIRMNVEANLSPEVNLRIGSSYTTARNRLAEGSGLQANTFHNLNQGDARNIFDGRRGFRYFPMEELSKIESRSDIDRITSSVELLHQPTSWFSHRLVGGIDTNAYHVWDLTPMQPEGTSHWFGNAALGTKSSTRGTRTYLTLDYSGSVSFDWRALSFQSSVGFQYYSAEDQNTGASSQQFPAVPITSISGGSVRTSGEGYTANSTVGVYLQEQVGWNDRVFLTAAMRGDDNSAFGAEYNAAIYPKLSAAWVISEEPFWTMGFVDQLRLRGAWGAAGQQPATFAASRLYDPVVGYKNSPALVPGAFGNAELKPERGEELEFGFDASLLNGRIEMEITRYQKALKDAIVQRPLAPSSGFTGSQIVNLGLIHAWGNEFSLTARLLERRWFSWTIDTQLATMQNEIKSMGGITSGAHRVGYSIADRFERQVLSAEINALGQVISAMCDGGTGPEGVDPGGSPVACAQAPQVWLGHSQPTWQVGIGSAFSILQNLTVYARVEGNGGHWQDDTGVGANGSRSRPGVVRDDPMYLARSAFGGGHGLYEAGFLRLREISANYEVPERLAQRTGARRVGISLGMRNVMMLWTKHNGWSTPRDGHLHLPLSGLNVWDPEIRSTGSTATGYQTVLPPTASLTMTLRASF
jgi:TonB-linked SusC/RagA family outer membrane protein